MAASSLRIVLALLTVLLLPQGVAERLVKLRASSRTGVVEDDGAEANGVGDKPLRIAIVGLTGDGKSSLSNWLLGKEGAFKVSNKTDSETKTVKVAEGHVFGDTTFPKLMIADTPGLADTKGEDATLWQNAVQDLRGEFDGEVDLMLWVVNGAGSRWSDQRQAMIETQRFTFGYKYWKHMAVMFTHWPTKVSDDDPTGNSKEVAEQKAKEWKKKLMACDSSYFANGMAGEDITSMPFYFVDLAPDLSQRFFKQYKGRWADAQDAVVWTYDKDGKMTYSKSGMDDLTALASNLMSKVASDGYEALDISDATPRMGPGEVDAEQEFDCFFPGDKRCEVPLKGRYLGDMDEVRLLPAGTSCGQGPQLDAVEAGLQFTQQRSRVDGGQTERFFDFGAMQGEHAIGTFEVCYCEAGHCADDRRFAQHAGQLHIKWSGCALPKYEAAAAVEPPENALLPRLGTQAFKCDAGHTTSGELGAPAEFAVRCDPSAERRIDEWIRCEAEPCHCLPIHCAVPATEAAEPAAGSPAVVPFSTEVRYNCRPGFTTDPNRAVSKGAGYSTSCLADGTTGPEQCVRVSCGAVPSRANAKSDTEGALTLFEGKASYTCATGYSTDRLPAGQQNGEFEVVCGAQGVFEPASAATECVPVTCGSVDRLAALPGASPVTPDEEVVYGGKTSYECSFGHAVKDAEGKLSSTFTRGCRADGTFEPSQGCQPMECAFTNHEIPARAKLLGASVVKFGEVFAFQCQEGNTTSGQPDGPSGFSIDCDPSVEAPVAEWRKCKTPPCQCQTVHCLVQSSGASVPAVSWQDGVPFGTEVKYNCRSGYTTDRNGKVVKAASYSTTCLADGTTGPEKCVRVSCGKLPARTHASSEIEGNVMHFEDSVTFTCAPGYSTDASPVANASGNNQYKITCGSSGSFEPASPAHECVPVSCGSPGSDIAGAAPSKPAEVVAFPDVAAYACDVGYAAKKTESGTLTATFERKCQEDGTFEPSEGCSQMVCGYDQAELPVKAKLLGPSTATHGNKFQFGCHEGHTTSGKAGGISEFMILCDTHAEKPSADWKQCETPPCHCLAVECALSGTVGSELADPSQTMVHFGTEVLYKCLPGFTTDEGGVAIQSAVSRTTCLADGTTGPDGCFRVSCGAVPSRTHASSDMEGQVFQFEQKATFTCATGYSTDGWKVNPSAKNDRFEIVCGTAGTFEPASSATECVPVKCGSVDGLPPVAGAVPLQAKKVVSFPDAAVYKCNEGHAAHGADGKLANSISRECRADGSFEPSDGCSAMECSIEASALPENTRQAGGGGLTVRYDQMFKFSCTDGHTVSGQPGGDAHFAILCEPSVDTASSEWTRCQSPPCHCLAVQCPVAASEAQVPAASSGAVPFGTEVSYNCRPGFTTDAAGAVVLNAAYTTSCLADGTTGPEQCVRVSCGEAPSRTHASSDMQGTVAHFEQKATFKCDEGYSTDGKPVSASTGNDQYQMVCSANGVYEAVSPAQECVAVTCGSVEKLPAIRGAKPSKPSEVVTFPHAAVYECDVGQVGKNEHGKFANTVARRCQPDGTFEPSEGCHPMECDLQKAGLPEHAQLVGAKSAIKFGEIAEYRCEDGYSLNGFEVGSESNFAFGLKCGAGDLEGQLAKPEGTCEPVSVMPKNPAFVITCDKDRKNALGKQAKAESCDQPQVVCAAGYSGTAEVQKSKTAKGAFQLSGCEPCEAGTFARAPNQEKCTACPANMYQNKQAQKSCITCRNGLFTTTHKLNTNESDCVDVAKHRCCCTADMQCALVHPAVQKSASGHVPTWWAEWQGGRCPQLDFTRHCATWGKYVTQHAAALPASNKEGSCTAGEIAIVDWKCHGDKDGKTDTMTSQSTMSMEA